jgi:DNA (cytosine-5)-methyltransferase 1
VRSAERTVELFAGIGGFRLASDTAGYKTVWANDLSEKACSVYRARFGHDSIREGDLRQLLEEVPGHDLLTAGFPCQPFSSAGKKSGIRDPRGTLFQNIVDVLAKHQPAHFVLENVKRLLSMEDGSHFATILQALASLDYRVEWRLLNAMHFGLAQNRQRVIIVGTRAGRAPAHPTSYLASSHDVLAVRDSQREDVLGPARHWTKIASHSKRFPWWGVAEGERFAGADLPLFSAAQPVPCLKDFLQEEHEVGEEFDFTESTLARIKNNEPVNRLVQGVEILSNQGGGARMGYTIFGVGGVAPTLTAATSRHYERYAIGSKFRRLTNVEYARLQGFRDDHCREISVYDQYMLYGNAVPPPMVEWVLRRIRAGAERLQDNPIRRQRSLFEAV